MPPALRLQVLMKVDIVYEKEMLYVYVLSGIGGLLVLLVIFAVLYKVGASGSRGPALDSQPGGRGFAGVRAETVTVQDR